LLYNLFVKVVLDSGSIPDASTIFRCGLQFRN